MPAQHYIGFADRPRRPWSRSWAWPWSYITGVQLGRVRRRRNFPVSTQAPFGPITSLVYAGIASAIVMLITGFVTEHVIGEAIGVPGSPFFAIVAVIVYGSMANICFTGGWILELLSRRIWGTRAEAFGEIAFTWGTLCSVLLTLVPAAITVVVGAFRNLAEGWKH
jgi:hypothetical protein